jgi:deoxyadenosine/deoxycytidine kinase
MSLSWPVVISVEGNIGSGKSTIINALKEFSPQIEGVDVVYVDEPVKQWEDIKSKDGKNMIELFYADPVKYSFAFQMMAYISRLTLLKEAIENNPRSIIITERCLLTDFNIFASMLHDQGKILDEEFSIYTKWFHYFQQDVEMSAIIYVYCEPEVSHERCVKRSRAGESPITLEYLTECHDKHDLWINKEIIPTLVINNTNSNMEDILYSITDFISDEIYDHEDRTEVDTEMIEIPRIIYNILWLFLWPFYKF